MPNGKGALECCYCIYYQGAGQGYREVAYQAGMCDYHHAELPSTVQGWGHRICRNFGPNADYDKDNPIWEGKRIMPDERFSWFKITLKPGMLYIFGYNTPEDIQELVKLSDKE